MNHAPKYSVIIPVYNAADTLRRCLDSLLCQPFDDYEIILVNDGSTDDSEAICRAYAEGCRRVRLLSRPNGGVSSARNAGLELALGTYILFVDSDDYIKPDMLEKLYAALTKEDADIAACGILTCEGDRQTAWGCQNVVGTPEEIAQRHDSYTGYYVDKMLKRAGR